VPYHDYTQFAGNPLMQRLCALYSRPSWRRLALAGLSLAVAATFVGAATIAFAWHVGVIEISADVLP